MCWLHEGDIKGGQGTLEAAGARQDQPLGYAGLSPCDSGHVLAQNPHLSG